jgi:hypothetical protein
MQGLSLANKKPSGRGFCLESSLFIKQHQLLPSWIHADMPNSIPDCLVPTLRQNVT